MKNADMPALTSGALYDESAEDVIPHRGLTKREHFAAMAMQGMLSNSNTDEFKPAKGDYYAFLAVMAVNQADALLAALEDC